MANKYYRGFEKLFKFGKSRGEDTGKSINTIVGVAPSKNIKKFQEQKEKILKTTDKYKSAVNDPEVKKKMSSGVSKTLSNISKIYKGEPITKKVKKVEKKAMGGRIGLKGGGSDMGSTTNKSINSLRRIREDLKNRKKSKITTSRRDRSPMEKQRVLDTMKSKAQAMGGDVRTAGEMKPLKGESTQSFEKRTESKVGGRIGRKLGGGTDMAKKKTNIQKIKETFGPKKNVPSKLKGFSKLPEAIQQKMNKKLAKKV